MDQSEGYQCSKKALQQLRGEPYILTPDKHSFSIEMKSKEHVHKISFSNSPNGEVIFEGELGEINKIELVEGIMLQISGINGTFRIDIPSEKLFGGLKTKKKQ